MRWGSVSVPGSVLAAGQNRCMGRHNFRFSQMTTMIRVAVEVQTLSFGSSNGLECLKSATSHLTVDLIDNR